MTGRHLVRVVAAVVLLTAATSLGLPSGPASAAACSGADGVSVVVDFHELGGVATGCVANGGGDTAASLFEVDHDLTRVQRYPGAVCKVDNTPADAACQNMPPTDAYWGLFWSDGSGGWIYSSEGVDSLNIPDGGSVAFAWQNGGDRDYPGVAPPQTAGEPSPSSSSSSPQPQPSSGSSGGGSHASPSSGSGGSSTGTARHSAGTSAPSDGSSGRSTPSASASRKDHHQPSASASASAAAIPSDDPTSSFSMSPDATPEAAPDASDPPDDGLPPWVAPVAIGLLFAAAAATAVVRRRRGAPGP